MWRCRLLNNYPARAWISGFSLLLCVGLVLTPGCNQATGTTSSDADHTANEPEQSADPRAGQDIETAPNDLPSPTHELHLPLPVERHTGDLGDMVKRRAIRALVVIQPMSFFYDGGRPRGVMYEALEEFQKLVNKKLNPGTIKVAITFVPVRLDQLEAALTAGVGDLIAY